MTSLAASMMRTHLLFLCAVLAGEACTSTPDPSDPLALTPLSDTNEDRDVVEVELVAAAGAVEYLEGKPADVWAFRDGADPEAQAMVPGPLLELHHGDEVIVHFRNDLPEATTIHWHGMRVPNASDGTPAAQVAVEPGESYAYEFTASDPGLFWYHPHMAADVQVERGLYGAVVVRGGVEPDVAADRVFVLDDVKIEANGLLSTKTNALDVMLGRQGNVVLVNGLKNPTLEVASNSRERWRFVNTANGRYFRLALEGHEFLVIAWDGGDIAAPYSTDSLLIAPGERYEVLVDLEGDAGTTIPLETLHYDRGHNVPDPGPIPIMQLSFARRAEGELPELPDEWGDIEALRVPADAAMRSIVLSEDENGEAEPRFYINGEAFPDVPELEAVSDAIDVWSVRNDTEMDHPFHLHGTFFQVLDDSGAPAEPLGWKDTVNVPQESTLHFAVRNGTPGRWMYHCHILEHAERGMMGELVVAP